MDIQNLVRERVIGNIKTGMKGENGLPKKLSYFHVEEDKSTSYEMVDIFKQLYPDKPTKLKIRFTSENPFNFNFKRYVNGKAVCIGNGTKAITVGKDAKNSNTKIEVECNEQCHHREIGKCKLKGSLKFVLEGIEAGGVWNLSTSGGISLSNIASEIVKYKKAGMSIVGVPFELTLTEQQSIAYGTYYSIDLHRTDIKPQLVGETTPELRQQETKQLIGETSKVVEKTIKKETKKSKSERKQEDKVIEITERTEVAKSPEKIEKNEKEDFSNYMTTKKFLPTLVNGKKFDKIIFEDLNGQDVEYILHPKADQTILQYGVGKVIKMESAKVESNMNILCKYSIKQILNEDGTSTEFKNEELKEAV